MEFSHNHHYHHQLRRGKENQGVEGIGMGEKVNRVSNGQEEAVEGEREHMNLEVTTEALVRPGEALVRPGEALARQEAMEGWITQVRREI